jgi:two-component sensor histidine kinase
MTARRDPDGFGLHIIERLASDLAITSEPDRGTVVRMSFPIGAQSASRAGRR